MFDKVKMVIDEWDPIELLSIQCPSDEYDEISTELSQILICNVDIELLGKVIYNLFVQAFGISTFDKSMDECKIIAQKILNLKIDFTDEDIEMRNLYKLVDKLSAINNTTTKKETEKLLNDVITEYGYTLEVFKDTGNSNNS